MIQKIKGKVKITKSWILFDGIIISVSLFSIVQYFLHFLSPKPDLITDKLNMRNQPLKFILFHLNLNLLFQSQIFHITIVFLLRVYLEFLSICRGHLIYN